MSWNRPKPPPLDLHFSSRSRQTDDFDTPDPRFNYGVSNASQASLDSPNSLGFDNVRLTAVDGDPERVQSRYEDSTSPLKRGTDTLMSVSRKLRRVSVRVVNIAAMDRGVRLDDDSTHDGGAGTAADHFDAPATNIGPLRGRTLGFLDPNSKIRLFMYNILVYQ